jgi:hypothetical protein
MSLHRTNKMILPALVVLSGLAAADLVLFPYIYGNGSFGNPVDVPFVPFPSTIPPACATALNSTIACDPAVQYLSAGGNYGVQNSSEVVCTTACGQSLASYHANVVSDCAGATLTSGLPNTFRGDLLWSFYNVSCLTDSTTGDNCLGRRIKRREHSTSADTARIPPSLPEFVYRQYHPVYRLSNQLPLQSLSDLLLEVAAGVPIFGV